MADKINITKPEILSHFNKDEMAKLLIGSKERYEIDKDLINYLFREMQNAKQAIAELVEKLRDSKKTIKELCAMVESLKAEIQEEARKIEGEVSNYNP